MIPKKIHYIWIGDLDNIPDIEKQWMDEAKALHPDFEFKIWTEKDIPGCHFLTNTISQGLYSYASDYIRCWILHNIGGFYLDTDMKLIKRIPDDWLNYQSIMPKETGWYISSFMLGSVKKSKLFGRILKKYTDDEGLQNPLDKEKWMPAEMWSPILNNTYGKWSINDPLNGQWKSTKVFKTIEPHECCPYYPWDETRVNDNVNLTKAIGIHYWNNYKSDVDLPLDSFNTKYFD